MTVSLLPIGSFHILEAFKKFWFDGLTHRSPYDLIVILILLNVLHITNQLINFIFCSNIKLLYCFFFSSEEENSTSESEDGSGKNTVHDSLGTLSQCIATIITFARIQLQRHPEISYPIPMLRVDPEGVVVFAYDYRSDVLMISQHIEWNDFAFIVVWLILHYSLFPPITFIPWKDYCCGYSAKSCHISFGDPWYLESPGVFSQSHKKLFHHHYFFDLSRGASD